jgi:hypothetical protein
MSRGGKPPTSRYCDQLCGEIVRAASGWSLERRGGGLRTAGNVLGGCDLGKSCDRGLDAREFLDCRDALAALGGASEGLVNFGDAAFLLRADAANLTIGKAVAYADVHLVHPPTPRTREESSTGRNVANERAHVNENHSHFQSSATPRICPEALRMTSGP